jgi:uncharacterized protein YjiK
MNYVYTIVLALLFVNCKSQEKKEILNNAEESIATLVADSLDYHFPYELKNYKEVIILPNELIELSGLSLNSDSTELLCNNDEKGNIYRLNTSGEIIETLDFGPKGDYEGIERVGDKVYTVNSSGTIFEYNVLTKSTTKYKTGLSQYNDVEGLGYDGESLLLACKGGGSIDKKDKTKNYKSVFKFNLQYMELNSSPFLVIKDEDLKSFFEKWNEVDQPAKKKYKKRLKDIADFSPSGIAMHPIDSTFYIISTVGKTLVVLDKMNNIKMVESLDENIHTQPESICFSKEGDLYIGNEGKGLTAKIYTYNSIK